MTSGLSRRLRRIEQGLERSPHVALDNARALRVRMDAVGDVERAIAGNSLEQERNEWHLVLGREIAERLAKRRGVRGTVIGGRLHAGKDHHDPAGPGARDDLAEVLL